MSSNGLQSFSSGLFLATAIIGGIYYLSQETHTAAPKPEDLEAFSISEMKQELEGEGFVVFTTEELEQERATTRDDQTDSEDSSTKEEPQIIYTMLLQITAGMSSYDVAEQLVRGHIIGDRTVFLDYVEANQLAQSLRVGEYELRSDMTIEEMLDRLT